MKTNTVMNMKKSATKNRILLVLKYLNEYTDELHTCSTYDIMDYLEGLGIHTDRKTMRMDIRSLQEAGYEIVRIQSRPVKYYRRERALQLSEMKLLVDAVSSSRFISEEMSEQIRKKLSLLLSENMRNELDRHVYPINRAETMDELVMDNMDTINEAIRAGRQIDFQYSEYTAGKEKVLCGDGEIYTISPYALYVNEDHYYVIGWSEKQEKAVSFRVDRIVSPEISEQESVQKPEDFDLNVYAQQILEMPDGEPVQVKLRCKEEMMEPVIDRFGEEVEIQPCTDGTFIVNASVFLSREFYSWIFRFAGDICILEPESAVKEIVKLAKSVSKAEKNPENWEYSIEIKEPEGLEDPEEFDTELLGES